MDLCREKVLQYDLGSNAVFVVLATVLVAVSMLLLSQFQARWNRLPPGPRPLWPVVGNLPALISSRHDMPHLTMHRLAEQFGGLLYLQLGSRPCVVVSTSEAAKEVFQRNGANFSSRPKNVAFSFVTGTSEYKNLVLAPYGPYWRQMRKLFNQELFSPKRHASYKDARAEEMKTMMKELLLEARGGGPVNLTIWLRSWTTNVTTWMLMKKRFFGKGHDVDQHAQQAIQELITRVFEVCSVPVISDFIPCLGFITKLQGLPAIFEKLRDDIDCKYVPQILDMKKHRQRAKDLQGNPDITYVPDFVDVLLETTLDDGKKFSDKQITYLVMELIVSGQDTSATTSEWAMAELMLQPALIQRAQAELYQVVDSDHQVQESHLPHLPFLHAIVKEAFRLQPPTPLSVPRESVEASQVLRYHIPAGTMVLLNLHTIHREPTVYENPDEFNPQRFMDHGVVNPLSGTIFYEPSPFGMGLRICPARNLGNLLVLLAVGNLLHNFDWAMPEGVKTLDMTPLFSIIMGRKCPLVLVPHPRNPIVLEGL